MWKAQSPLKHPKRIWDELPRAHFRKPQGRWASGPPQDSRKLQEEIKELKAKLRKALPSEANNADEVTEEVHADVDSQARQTILNVLHHTKDPLLLELHAKL